METRHFKCGSHSHHYDNSNAVACASFLLPGHRIRHFPRAFYQDWLSVLTDESQPDQGRECFEHVVYTWFGDEEHLLFTTEQIDDFYKAANGLIYANEHNETRFNGSFIESTRLLSIE